MYSTVYIHGVDIEVLLLIGNTVPCWLVCCFQQAMSHFWKGCVKSNEESDLQCFITVINKGLNDVKCSKASNTLCTIHDPWVVILLLLFQLTFPPAFMFPLLDKLLLPQRWSRKTSLFGSSQETEWMLKTIHPTQATSYVQSSLSFTHFSSSIYFIQNKNFSSGGLMVMFLEGFFQFFSPRFVFEVQAPTCAGGHKYPNRCWISKDFEQMAR